MGAHTNATYRSLDGLCLTLPLQMTRGEEFRDARSKSCCSAGNKTFVRNTLGISTAKRASIDKNYALSEIARSKCLDDNIQIAFISQRATLIFFSVFHSCLRLGMTVNSMNKDILYTYSMNTIGYNYIKHPEMRMSCTQMCS